MPDNTLERPRLDNLARMCAHHLLKTLAGGAILTARLCNSLIVLVHAGAIDGGEQVGLGSEMVIDATLCRGQPTSDIVNRRLRISALHEAQRRTCQNISARTVAHLLGRRVRLNSLRLRLHVFRKHTTG